MPRAIDLFPSLEQMDVITLNERYNTLREIPEADKTDDDLLEMISILGILRRKSAGPPKAARAKPSTAAPSLDDL